MRRHCRFGVGLSLTAAVVFFTLVSVSSAASVRDQHGGLSAGPHTRLIVPTQSGLVQGQAEGFNRRFLGIPYAAAPVGTLRWAPPQPPAKWTGVRDAFQDPENCPQLATSDPGLTTNSLDEDCLGLDIITPMPLRRRLRPVYVFIHGGAWVVGHLGYENMSEFVERTGAIAVSINYRLGALGFLDLPQMGRGAGNFALLDQEAALRWVQRNIAAFGGDPNNVTIGGQSAGGGSVCSLLASPAARGLFERAAIESGWDCNDTRTQADAQAESVALADQVGCSSVATMLSCMRNTAVLPIIEAENRFPQMTWAPETGTPQLPQSPAAAFTDGSFNKVPVVLGSNSHDIPGLGCLTEGYAQDLSQWVPTYRYDFADDTAPPLPGRPASQAGHGAQHSAELEYLYLFNDLPAPLNAAQQDLADQMIRYWGQFIKLGDPNAAWLVAWPRFRPSQPNVLTLTASGTSVTTDYSTEYSCTS
jgi:para-nitrobenzyl esterase